MPDGVHIDAIVVTCEHAGRRVPRGLRTRFESAAAKRALAGHRGFDPGALAVARWLAQDLEVPLIACLTSRLVVEVNRSLTHPRVFSEFTRDLDTSTRAALIDGIYHPHRQRVEAALRARTQAHERVLHLGVHSFTPRLNGVTRLADIALLYNPARSLERALCRDWTRALRERTALRIRRNCPYRGNADGLTTALRRTLPARRYLGIEIEINQGLLTHSDRPGARQLSRWLTDTLYSCRAT